MSEVWKLHTADGEEYNLATVSTPGDSSYDHQINLLVGTMGQYGSPRTIQSDSVPNIAGTEYRNTIVGDRTVYLPLLIIGQDRPTFHKIIAKFRKSVTQIDEHQLWLTHGRAPEQVEESIIDDITQLQDN